MSWWAGYGAALVVMGVLDAFWLGWAMRDFYAQALGDQMADPVRKVPAAIFYFAYPAAVMFLALTPRPGSLGEAVFRAAVFGLVAYGVYDLTNLATLKIWSVKLALIDMAWGTFATALVGAAAWWAVQAVAKR